MNIVLDFPLSFDMVEEGQCLVPIRYYVFPPGFKTGVARAVGRRISNGCESKYNYPIE